jgi:hypothetical protein
MATGATKAPARKNSAVRASTFRVGSGALAGTQTTIANVTGGSVIDVEGRVATNAILVRLKAFGLIS